MRVRGRSDPQHMPPVLSESQLLRSQDKVEPIVGAALEEPRLTNDCRHIGCCRPAAAAERSLGSARSDGARFLNPAVGLHCACLPVCLPSHAGYSRLRRVALQKQMGPACGGCRGTNARNRVASWCQRASFAPSGVSCCCAAQSS